LSSNFLKIIYRHSGILKEKKIFYFKLLFIWHFGRKKIFYLNFYLSGVLEEKNKFYFPNI